MQPSSGDRQGCRGGGAAAAATAGCIRRRGRRRRSGVVATLETCAPQALLSGTGRTAQNEHDREQAHECPADRQAGTGTAANIREAGEWSVVAGLRQGVLVVGSGSSSSSSSYVLGRLGVSDTTSETHADTTVSSTCRHAGMRGRLSQPASPQLHHHPRAHLDRPATLMQLLPLLLPFLLLHHHHHTAAIQQTLSLPWSSRSRCS